MNDNYSAFTWSFTEEFQGDSGSLFVCQAGRGRWRLQGVMTGHGENFSVFSVADLTKYKPWIEEQILIWESHERKIAIVRAVMRRLLF